MRRRVRFGAFEVSVVVCVALVASGFVGLWAAWRGIAALLFVPFQVPYAVSGGLGGLAITGFALGLLSIQASRRSEATRRAEFERVIDAAVQMLEAVRREPAP